LAAILAEGGLSHPEWHTVVVRVVEEDDPGEIGCLRSRICSEHNPVRSISKKYPPSVPLLVQSSPFGEFDQKITREI
jgi:hypothetical protein